MRADSCQGKSHAYFANLKNSLSLAARRQSSSLRAGAFLALPPGELAFAEQMTERANMRAGSCQGKSHAYFVNL